MLPAYAKVTGVVDAAGSTFQTGDTINGTANNNNKVIITDAGAFVGTVTATVNNVAEVKHNLLASNTYNEALYSGVVEEYITNSTGTVAAPVALTLNNAQLATVFGAKDSTAGSTTLNVGIRASDLTGTANTLNLSVRNAGSTIVQAGVAPVSNQVTINSTSTGIEAIALATSGVNNIVITDNPAAGVTTDYAKLTVTGDGANTIDVSALTQNLNYDLSATTGANTLQFAGALQSNTVVVGGSAADSVRVNQGTVVAGISLTGVETLRSSVGDSTGTIAFTTSSLNTIRVDGDDAEAGALTLIAPGSVATVNYIGDGLATRTAAVEAFKGLIVTGAYAGTSDTVTLNFSNAGTTNTFGYNVGTAGANAALIANGVENLIVNTSNITSAATTTFANNGAAAPVAISSNTLQTIKFTSAGAIQAGVIQAAPVAGNSALTLVDLSAVTGDAQSQVSFVGVASIGAATQVKGSEGAGGTRLLVGAQDADDVLLYTHSGSGNDQINARVGAWGDVAAASFNGTLVATLGSGAANVVRVGEAGGAGTSTSTITISGVGSGNTITGGGGVDTITVNATALGSTTTVNAGAGKDVVNASASTVAVILNGEGDNDTLTGGAGNDTIDGGSGNDTINANNGTNGITGGTGNDNMTGGTGVDTYVQVVLDSTAASASSNTGATAIANGNTISFSNGVDVITNFVSGTDKIDTSLAGSVTSFIGIAGNANLTLHGNYAVVGTYTGGIFTVNTAATAATTNVATLVLADATAAAWSAAGNTDYIILTGIAGVVAADFM